MSILNHRWNESPAADRVWAQVSGLAPSLHASCQFMVLQAFIDESINGPNFVLAGHIASPESWAQFSIEWEELLPLAKLGKGGVRRFKMSEMALSDEHLQNSAAFWRVIERHVHATVAVYFNVDDSIRARGRLSADEVEIDWGIFDNPYWLAYDLLITMLHQVRGKEIHNILSEDDIIDFYFDERAEKSEIIPAWDGVPSIYDKAKYGATPRFENDEKFLPLQAADFWAWWVRRWISEGGVEALERKDFKMWKSKRQIPSFVYYCDENSLVSIFAQKLRSLIPWDRVVYDRGIPIALARND